MSKHQTRGQKQASAAQHRAIIHLRSGGTLRVNGGFWVYCSGGPNVVLGQPVRPADYGERLNVLVLR